MITNYAELQAAIANYTHRADLGGVIPDFIRLAEARFDRVLARVSETEKRVTAIVESEYLALPIDYLALRNIQINGTKQFLKYRTPQQIDEMYQNASGTTCVYTIIGSEFQFVPAPTVAAPITVEIAYYARMLALSITNATNWLLTKHPDAYLYGSLLQTEAYGYKDERLPIWKSAYDEVMAEIMGLDELKRWGGGALTMQTLTTV